MIEDTIIYSLITNSTYFNSVYDKIFKYNKKIFEDKNNQYIVKLIEKHYYDKNAILSFDDILLKIENNKKLEESVYESLKERTNFLKQYSIDVTIENLKVETKKFIQDTLVEKFMYKCAEFLGDERNNTSHEELLTEMEEITGISFDNDIGHFANTRKLFTDYFVNKIKFGFEPLDELTHGGLPKKTLNIIYGAAHAGKTQLMIHIACTLAMAGVKVCYISSELSEEMLKQRIDSWFFEMPTWKINPKYMTVEQYDEMITVVENAMKNINIKAFPTESASAIDVKAHYERLIKDENFTAGIILVDSINQMSSVKKNLSLDKTHIKLKYTFTEFRALAFVLDIPILSPTHLSDEGERLVEQGENVTGHHVGEFKQLKAIADWICGFKLLYTDKNGVIYKDFANEKCIPEQDYELWENKYFTKLVMLNIIKSRYGSRVGEYRYLGSNIDYSKFYDFVYYWKNKDETEIKPMQKQESINNKKEEKKTEEPTSTFAGRKKRTKF